MIQLLESLGPWLLACILGVCCTVQMCLIASFSYNLHTAKISLQQQEINRKRLNAELDQLSLSYRAGCFNETALLSAIAHTHIITYTTGKDGMAYIQTVKPVRSDRD